MILGLCLIIGFFLYLIFVSHIVDTFGRFRAFTVGMIIQILLLIAVMVTPHGSKTVHSNMLLYILYFLVTIYSVAYHLVYYSGWIYILELLPSKYHSFAIILSNTG
jgi:MFS family permease